MTPEEAVKDSILRFEAIYDFSLESYPIDCRTEQSSGFNDSLKAGLLAASLSWLGSNHYGDFNALELLNLVFEDLESDGLLDGNGYSGDILTLGFGYDGNPINLDANTMRSTLARGVMWFLADERNFNSTSLDTTNPELLDWLDRISTNTDPIFDQSQPTQPVDIQEPVITFSLESGMAMKDIVNFTVTATDETSLLSLYIENMNLPAGSYVHNQIDQKTQSISIDYITSSLISDGEYTFTFFADDTAGNRSRQSITIYVDNTDPLLDWSEDHPANDGLYGNTQIPISGNATDNYGLESLILSYGDNPNSTIDILPDSSGAFATTIDNLQNGNYTISITATDFAGNVTQDHRMIYFDNTPPTITLEEFPWTTDRSKFYLCPISYCPEEVILIDEGLFLDSIPTFQKIAEKTWNYTHNNIPRLLFNVADESYNGTTNPEEITVQYTHIFNGTEQISRTTINYDQTDGYFLDISRTSVANIGSTSKTDLHTLRIYVTDHAGNTTTSEYSFHIDLIPATLTGINVQDFDTWNVPHNLLSQHNPLSSCKFYDQAYSGSLDIICDDNNFYNEYIHTREKEDYWRIGLVKIQYGSTENIRLKVSQEIENMEVEVQAMLTGRYHNMWHYLRNSGHCNGSKAQIYGGNGYSPCQEMDWGATTYQSMPPVKISTIIVKVGPTNEENIQTPRDGYYIIEPGEQYRLYLVLKSLNQNHLLPSTSYEIVTYGQKRTITQYGNSSNTDFFPEIMQSNDYLSTDFFSKVAEWQRGYKLTMPEGVFDLLVARNDVSEPTFVKATKGQYTNPAFSIERIIHEKVITEGPQP